MTSAVIDPAVYYSTRTCVIVYSFSTK